MQEAFIDSTEWTEFWENWDRTVKKLPAMKAEMLQAIGGELQKEVRAAVLRTGVNDAHGRVRSWQNPHVGSRLGYVAVRPDSVEVRSGGGGRIPVNAGALTNYLNSGHRVRNPSGRARRYVPRARMTRVPGAGFYQAAGSTVFKTALAAAEKYLREIKEEVSS